MKKSSLFTQCLETWNLQSFTKSQMESNLLYQLLSSLLSKNRCLDFSPPHLKTAFHQSSKNLCKLTFEPPLNKLSTTLKSDMGKLVTTLINSGMKEVRDDLKSQAKSLGKFCLDVQSMQTKCNDIQSLLEIAGEQPADAKVANKESAPPASDNKSGEGKELIVHNSEKKKSEGIISKESAPPASNAMLNEGKELVVHNSEEKKSEGIISVEDDSDEDDK
ncbi:hypothetical protein Tco_0461654 [Tanacetum coccineum]